MANIISCDIHVASNDRVWNIMQTVSFKVKQRLYMNTSIYFCELRSIIITKT